MKRGILGLPEEAGERNAGGRGAGETKRNLSTIPLSVRLWCCTRESQIPILGMLIEDGAALQAGTELQTSKDVCADT